MPSRNPERDPAIGIPHLAAQLILEHARTHPDVAPSLTQLATAAISGHQLDPDSLTKITTHSLDIALGGSDTFEQNSTDFIKGLSRSSQDREKLTQLALRLAIQEQREGPAAIFAALKKRVQKLSRQGNRANSQQPTSFTPSELLDQLTRPDLRETLRRRLPLGYLQTFTTYVRELLNLDARIRELQEEQTLISQDLIQKRNQLLLRVTLILDASVLIHPNRQRTPLTHPHPSPRPAREASPKANPSSATLIKENPPQPQPREKLKMVKKLSLHLAHIACPKCQRWPKELQEALTPHFRQIASLLIYESGQPSSTLLQEPPHILIHRAFKVVSKLAERFKLEELQDLLELSAQTLSPRRLEHINLPPTTRRRLHLSILILASRYLFKHYNAPSTQAALLRLKSMRNYLFLLRQAQKSHSIKALQVLTYVALHDELDEPLLEILTTSYTPQEAYRKINRLYVIKDLPLLYQRLTGKVLPGAERLAQIKTANLNSPLVKSLVAKIHKFTQLLPHITNANPAVKASFARDIVHFYNNLLLPILSEGT